MWHEAQYWIIAIMPLCSFFPHNERKAESVIWSGAQTASSVLMGNFYSTRDFSWLGVTSPAWCSVVDLTLYLYQRRGYVKVWTFASTTRKSFCFNALWWHFSPFLTNTFYEGNTYNDSRHYTHRSNYLWEGITVCSIVYNAFINVG